MTAYHCRVGDREITVEILSPARARIDGREIALPPGVQVEREGDRYAVAVGGHRLAVSVQDAWERMLGPGSGGAGVARSEILRAPMPGIVTRVAVAAGQAVAPGDLLLVLEAMKMANEIRAERAATVTEVSVKPGQTVSAGFGLVTLA